MANSGLGEGYSMIIDKYRKGDVDIFCFKLAYKGNVMFEAQYNDANEGYRELKEYMMNLP